MKVFVLLWALMSSQVMASSLVNIGVLSHRGDSVTIENWQPLAVYLSQSIPSYHFKIVPLDFEEIDPSIKHNEIDFLLVNPSIYVVMEVKYRISRIATLNKRVFGQPINKFGGVIFTRKDRKDINTLIDLKNKTFMAVNKTSLGGYQMAWREMLDAGIDLKKDLKSIEFGGIHDEVVNSVLKGSVDVGTVRTGILENMASSGSIDYHDIKIINKLQHDDFPSINSTRLYPEWPLSKLTNTSNALAKSVAIALLEMSENNVKNRSFFKKYAGWTIPLGYQPVHKLLQELNLPPYDEIRQFTLVDAIKKYSHTLLMGLVFIIIIIFMMIRVYHLNKQLKKSQRRLKNEYSLILDSVADGIYGVDLEGNSTFVNKAMENITGWTSSKIVGKNQHDLLHHTLKDGTPHEHHNCPVYKTFKDDKPRHVRDDIFWKSNGESFPVEYSSTPLKDEKSATIGSVVVFRDVSERINAENQLREYKIQLEHVARLSNMGEMASGMAHELNQPLTAILTNSQACIRLLDSKEDNAELLMDTLEIIGGQSQRASAIINQLRRFVTKGSAELLDIDLNESIKQVIVLLEKELDNEGVSLELDLDKKLQLVSGQPIQIDQVILNLIKNSIESLSHNNNREKHIKVFTQVDGNFVKMCVSDNGNGIDEDILNYIFAPYKTSKEQGMGLGLSISEGIIQEHDGKIYARNKSGHGAEFCFKLPIKIEAND